MTVADYTGYHCILKFTWLVLVNYQINIIYKQVVLKNTQTSTRPEGRLGHKGHSSHMAILM